MEAIRDKVALKQLQSLPLDAKITLAEQRIMEWYKHFNGDVCISFSGGKDSTVLAHLVHGIYPDVPMVFANTGLEYPEIQSFARKMGAEFVRPKMSFSEVITRYGYPIISKEVSEAIHAARYIVSKNRGSVDILEREREREYSASRNSQHQETKGTAQQEKARPGWKWADQKRNELNGTRTKASTPPNATYQRMQGQNQRTQAETRSTQGITSQKNAPTISIIGLDGDEKLSSG